MERVVGEDSFDLAGEVGGVPGLEGEAAGAAVPLDGLGDSAVVGDEDWGAVAHGLGGDHAEGFAVDGGVDDASAAGIEGVADLGGDSAAMVDGEAEVFGDVLEDLAVALAEA